MTDNMRGAMLMMTCMVAFTVNDSFMKVVLQDLPLLQALALRGLITSLGLGALAFVMGGIRLPPLRRDRVLIGIRTLAEVIAAWFFMSALIHMPIANVSAILQVLPLSVTLASALVFREPLGWRRLTAIGIGFCGVLLIVRPGTEGFDVYSLYAVCAVVAVTVRDLAARRLSAEVSSLTVALVTAIGVMVASGLASLGGPSAPVTSGVLGLLLVSSVFVIVGYLASVGAMRSGDIGFVAPFRYTSLVAALILGFVIFGDWPAPLTLAGAAIVVGTGLFTLSRELRQARLARQAAKALEARTTAS